MPLFLYLLSALVFSCLIIVFLILLFFAWRFAGALIAWICCTEESVLEIEEYSPKTISPVEDHFGALAGTNHTTNGTILLLVTTSDDALENNAQQQHCLFTPVDDPDGPSVGEESL